MQFQIGAALYSVRVSLGPIHDEAGKELWAYCDESERAIVLSPALKPVHRSEKLRHEFFHALSRHLPGAMDEEQQAVLFASASESFEEQFQAQGGRDALEQMKASGPKPLIPPGKKSSEQAWRDPVECPLCHASIPPGSIVTASATFRDDLRTKVAQRAGHCDCCACVTIWWERCTEAGYPDGTILQVPAPRVLRGREAMDFVRGNPAVAPEIVMV